MLRLILTLAILAFTLPVAGQTLRYAHTNGDVITLHPVPCADSIRSMHRVRDDVPTHRAEVLFSGRLYAGCWATDGAGVYLMWEDGDRGFMPLSSFQPASGAAPARTGKLDA